MEIRPGRMIGPGEPVYVIAEIGANFDGSLEKARRLVDLAKEAGCDAVKFQTFQADDLLSERSFTMRTAHQQEWDQDPYETYEDAEFPPEWHEDVAAYAKRQDVDFFSSPYSRGALDLLVDLGVDIIKIGSGEIDNHAFLHACGRTGKTLLLATGAATLSDVDCAMQVIENAGALDRTVLLQCTTSYPCPYDQANLRAMETLRAAFDVPVGYSDHTPGIEVPIAMAALGGHVLEKHLTDSRENEGPDHPHSVEPDEMRRIVDGIRAVEKALGDGKKRLTENEEETVVLQRRSLHALTDISAGEDLSQDNVGALRPANGIKPPHLETVLGRSAKEDIPRGETITWDMV